jgi:arylsulfatase A-like enzyme
MLARRFVIVLLFVWTAHLSAATPPNIIIITLDTTRADRMGFLGSQQGLTPKLDELAQDSVVFTHAYSQVPLTTASHATILSGTYPQFHKVNDAGVPLPRTVPYAPSIFRQHGYATAGFVGSVILDPKAGAAPGFGRGFDVYDAGFHTRQPHESRYSSVERRGGEVVEHAAAWLRKGPRRPFFLWIHLYDPHAPYDAPEPFKSKYASDAYAGEIAYTDSVVGELLKQLRELHLYDDSTIAVMADHGEALGEHGERGHGIFLYDTTIHVPLLIKLASQKFAGKRVEAKVGLVDILPTLLDTAGFTAPQSVQGKSALPLIGETARPERFAYAETDYPHTQFGWSSLRSIRRGKYLFIEAPRSELYDQNTDAAAAQNLATTSTAVASTLRDALNNFRRQTAGGAASGRTRLSAEQASRLRALGYLASADAGSATTAPSSIDPKDKIEIANQMTEANLAIEEDRYDEAKSKLQRVIQMDSTFAPAYTELGQLLSAHGQPVELRPESVSAHYSLGLAFFQAGDLTSAAPQFEAAIARNPGSAEMRYSLASIYVRIDRMEDAKKQLAKALAIEPNLFDANLMMGQIFVVQKKPQSAISYLKKASSLRPNAPEPHRYLADAYIQVGQKEIAERERSLAGGSKQ